jgi:uncharacterized peroxidase-related enzyme
MPALPLIETTTADPALTDLFALAQRQLGGIPNMARAMANSPALLEGYMALSGALGKGRLRTAVREQIALTVSQSNGCSYCLSAHSYLADRVAHLNAATIAGARRAESADPKIAAILRLASAINDTRGSLGEGLLDEARAAGLSDGEIAETIGNVALNVLTNYFNKVAEVEIDFPVVTA